MAVLKVKRFSGDDKPSVEKQIAIWLAKQPPNALVQRAESPRKRSAPRSVVVTVWSD